MAHSIKEADGTTRTTTQGPDPRGVTLTVPINASDRTKGANIYVRESVASNGDITWRFLRFEPPAK